MSQSLSQTYLHVVFSTKDRRPYLQELATRDAMHKCLAKFYRTLAGFARQFPRIPCVMLSMTYLH
jgi:hypothetical protein